MVKRQHSQTINPTTTRVPFSHKYLAIAFLLALHSKKVSEETNKQKRSPSPPPFRALEWLGWPVCVLLALLSVIVHRTRASFLVVACGWDFASLFSVCWRVWFVGDAKPFREPIRFFTINHVISGHCFLVHYHVKRGRNSVSKLSRSIK